MSCSASCSSSSCRRRGPCERQNGDGVVGAGHNGPGRGCSIELHKLVRARGGGDEVRECGKKGRADCDTAREGCEDEADAARLRGGLRIDAHLHDVDDARVEGLELGRRTVAAVLLGVVHVAHGVVARDGEEG